MCFYLPKVWLPACCTNNVWPSELIPIYDKWQVTNQPMRLLPVLCLWLPECLFITPTSLLSSKLDKNWIDWGFYARHMWFIYILITAPAPEPSFSWLVHCIVCYCSDTPTYGLTFYCCFVLEVHWYPPVWFGGSDMPWNGVLDCIPWLAMYLVLQHDEKIGLRDCD